MESTDYDNMPDHRVVIDRYAADHTEVIDITVADLMDVSSGSSGPWPKAIEQMKI